MGSLRKWPTSSAAGLLFCLLAFAARAQNEPSQIGRDVAISSHLQDGEEYQLSVPSVTFYFVAAANSQQVTFTLNYVDNQSHDQTATATATFNIAGPSNSGVATQLGQVAINPGPYLQFGSTSGSNIGINFTASANQPAGYSPVFKWVNLISNDTVVLNGTQTTSLGTGFDVNPSGGYPSFPNVTANTTNDNPKYQLLPACTEVKRTFDAQTYLMWNASLTNPASIDVPLGSLTWGFS